MKTQKKWGNIMKYLIITLNKFFIYTTLIWSSVMLAVYLIVLFEIPFFALISYLPLGEFICDILVFLLLFGIWVVPVLYIITITLLILTRVKFKQVNQNRRLFLLVAILPVILAFLMLLTNFNEVLS